MKPIQTSLLAAAAIAAGAGALLAEAGAQQPAPAAALVQQPAALAGRHQPGHRDLAAVGVDVA
jgi:hypothetical protein